MIRTHEIVVGVDGSASGWVALRWAADEAALRACLLHIVHCVEFPVAMVWRDGPIAPVPPVTTGSRHDLLDEAVRRVQADHLALSLRTELVGDTPPYGLLHIARGAGLLVVGSRGMSLITGLLVGSTALQVALHGRCPVAVIPAESPHPNGPFPGRIVVGVDGSDDSTAALAFAFDEAERRATGIVAVHAPTYDADERSFIGDITEMYTAEPSRKMLASIVDPWVRKHPNVLWSSSVVAGSPLCNGYSRERETMKALVYQGPGQRVFTDVADPEIIDSADAIVRVDAVTICGTDLHILRGDVPTCEPGRILGHEAVGTIEAVGDGVRALKVGDRVLVSCITSCGRCRFCREGRYGQCLGGGGWILGHRINGTQAERVRVPFADTSAYVLPDSVSDEAALMLADILPTGYEVGVLAGQVRPGDTVVVVGSGPIGLAAMTTARFFSPSHVVAIDLAEGRLAAALKLGADIAVNANAGPAATVRELTDGLGADVVIEAVGVPASFELCTELVRPGGHVANIGVHGRPAILHLETLWIKDITITTGLVDTVTTPTLLRMLAGHQLETTNFVTHRFGFGEAEEAYDVFTRPEDSGALKVAMFRT